MTEKTQFLGFMFMSP